MSFSQAFAATYTDIAQTMTAPVGTAEGVRIRGGAPGQTVRIIGTTALATITTGVNAGTGGAGTTATSLAKPAAAANWTASDLVGKWLKITGGGGFATDGTPTLRPILANTTTTIGVNSVTGMDSTTVFEVVTLGTLVDTISSADAVGIAASFCYGPVELYGLSFSNAHAFDSLVHFSDCASVKVSACEVNDNAAAFSVLAERCGQVVIEHCRLSNSGDIKVRDWCQSVEIDGCVNSAGGVISAEDCNKVTVTKLTASSSPSRVLSLVRVNTATLEADCSGGGATPIYLEAVANCLLTGGGLTGSGNTGYGLEIALSGQYVITGATITGTTGDVLFEGANQRYSVELSTSYGAVASMVSRVVAQTVPTQTIVSGNTLFLNEVYFSSRVLFYGIFNPPQTTGLTATGTNSATAFQLPAGEFYAFSTVAAGTGAKFHNASALPGPRIIVFNAGANALTLYPTSGTINGAGSVTVAAGAIAIYIIVDYGSDRWLSL